jgi:hypothetical protein
MKGDDTRLKHHLVICIVKIGVAHKKMDVLEDEFHQKKCHCQDLG